MPDSTKAALWFSKITIARFKEQARVKMFKIKKCNDILSNGSFRPYSEQSHALNENTCPACQNIFKPPSKPSLCPLCSRYFHRGCIKNHTKACKSGPQTCFPSASQMYYPTITTATVSRRSSSLTFVPYTSSEAFLPHSQSEDSMITSTSNNADHVSIPPPVDHLQGASAATYSVNVLPSYTLSTGLVPQSDQQLFYPSVTQHIPQSQSSGSINTGLLGAIPRTSTAKTKVKTTDQKEVEITFLRRELGAAQARIVQLDNEIDDKNKRIAIQEHRIKLLEDKEKDANYNKYFSSNTFSTPASTFTGVGRANCLHCSNSSTNHI